MMSTTANIPTHPLVKLMIDLANEVDGVADFGITVCLIDEEKMAGRQQYINQRSEKILVAVDSIISFIKGTTQENSEQVLLAQAELLAGSLLLTSGFKALQYFRRLTPETLCGSTSALRTSWEAIHRSIPQLPEAMGVLDDSWYAAIAVRQESYRTRLGSLYEWFQEASIAGSAAGGRPIRDRLHPHDDFEATVRIYSTAEGGRRTPAFNGIRWDFAYAENHPPDTLYMIWPDFFAANGQNLPSDQPLPVGVELCARMTVVVDEMRAEVHGGRIAPGVRFFCQEGGRRVAEGVVTRITGLFTPRPSQDAEPS